MRQVYKPDEINEVPRVKMKKFTQRFLRDNKGVTAIEYGLIAGLLVIVIASAVNGMSGKLTSLFDSIGSEITTATPAAAAAGGAGGAGAQN
jgi:pilus assembly protein Flp/PilA